MMEIIHGRYFAKASMMFVLPKKKGRKGWKEGGSGEENRGKKERKEGKRRMKGERRRKGERKDRREVEEREERSHSF